MLLVISDVWALISLGLGRFRLRYLPTDMWVVLPAVLIHSRHGRVDTRAAERPGRSRPRHDTGDVPDRSAPRGAMPRDAGSRLFRRFRACRAALRDPAPADHGLAGPQGEPRVSGFAGNAFPFAMICAFLGPVALLNLARRSHLMAVFSLVGF